jgi:hypothetical protein
VDAGRVGGGESAGQQRTRLLADRDTVVDLHAAPHSSLVARQCALLALQVPDVRRCT